MKLHWNVQRGGVRAFGPKKPSLVEVWTFPGSTHSKVHEDSGPFNPLKFTK